MSKYEPLWKYLKDNNKENYKVSYEEIKNIIGFEIDHSFLTYKKEAKEFGYEVVKYLWKKRQWFSIRKITIYRYVKKHCLRQRVFL